MTIRPSAVTLAAVFTFGLSATPLLAQGKLGNPAALTEQAPATYKARFDTSKGVFVIDVNRDWAPAGADRFYNLVKNGFYDENRFFRVISGMNVVDQLYSEYGEGAPGGRGPNQGRIQSEGNAYLTRDFPNLDFVRKATISQ